MSLASGTRLGPYQIEAPLGAGGMGEVYRARDTRLDRTVAIKVLPAHVVDDPLVRMRFERESKTIAALNHPHICTLHDIGEASNPEAGQGSIQFLVLEFIEGESLADRLTKGPLPLDQALRYAGQIADALDRAHRQGIVHRDLKPGNVMLAKGGAKLLDFGLAKQAVPAATALGGLSTKTAGVITAEGTILGTCQYMAPEQLEGHEADSRSDIWAFGALLYEMVTGKTAFAGKSYVSLIAAILQRDPEPMSKLQPLSPALLEHIVQTCLAKDPDDRWQSMADVRRELAWCSQSGAHVAMAIGAARGTRRRALVPWVVAAVATMAAIGATWFAMSRPTTEPAQTPARFTVGFPDMSSSARFSVVSPDGRYLAFVANGFGKDGLLWVRSLNALEDAHTIAGIEGAQLPFWSPDGRAIGFFSGGKLRWVDLATGVVQIICDAPSGRGGTWNRDNTIVFAPDQQVPLFQVSAAAGAKPVQLTTLSRTSNEYSHRLPSFLPDGRHFLLTVLIEPGRSGIKIGSLDSAATTELVTNVTTQAMAADGFLLFGRDGPLFAQPFDQHSLRLTGEAIAVVPAVRSDTYGWAAFSASEGGLLFYRPPTPPPVTQLTWFTRAGAPGKAVGQPGALLAWSLSPDGRHVALTRNVGDTPGERTVLQVLDLDRETTVALKSPPDTGSVAWSADSTRLVVSALRGLGMSELYVLPADGTGAAEQVAGSLPDSFSQGESPDGKYRLFRGPDLTQGGAHYHLFTTPIAGVGPPTVFARDAGLGTFSPDGQWIAYLSSENTLGEVYVQPFPSGPRVPVTSGSVGRPFWGDDGNEILFIRLDKVMAVGVRRSAGPKIEIGTARALFDLPPGAAWEPTRDSRRFLVQVPVGARPAPPPLTVIVNWAANVRKSPPPG